MGGMEPAEVEEHIRYYSDYIDSQMRMGMGEEAVLASLGEPRLIAKTLLEMDHVEAAAREVIDDEPTGNPKRRFFELKGQKIKLPGWMITILVCLVSFCILTVVFALLAKLLPFLWLMMLGVFFYRMIRKLFR